MLAEKFFLVLETLLSHAEPDGSPRIVSTSAQVSIKRKGVSAGAALPSFLRLDREADGHLG
jgi:hypothetical protein